MTGTTPKAACSTAWSNMSASLRSPSRRPGVAAAPSASASSNSAFNLASVERSRCSAAASSGLRAEPVADFQDRFDPGRLLEDAPELMHGLLDAVLEPGVARPPDLLEQLRAGDHLTGAPGQQLQHQEWPAFYLDGTIAEPGLSPRQVDA